MVTHDVESDRRIIKYAPKSKEAREARARDAFNRGFYSVVVSDCVSSPNKDGHNRSLENMKNLEIQKRLKMFGRKQTCRIP
jgi:nicotinamidase-related amidase